MRLPTGLAVGLARRLALRGHQTAIRPRELGSPVSPPREVGNSASAPYQDLTPPQRSGLCSVAVSFDDRTQDILARVRAVPVGFVRTYGDISPGAPRVAGAVLHDCHDPGLPWHRIVRADGSLAKGDRQRRLLEAEGVPFRGSRVDMRVARVPDL